LPDPEKEGDGSENQERQREGQSAAQPVGESLVGRVGKERGGLRRKGGISLGETDDLGYNITKDPVGIRDLQATIMHAAGLNPHRFSYRYQGLAQRYIGPSDEGKVLKQLLKFG
jgi:hypothetical protein